MRHVEAVVAAELEVEVVADDPAHLLRVEADEPADAVVLVHDVVAGAQVGDRRERPPEPGRAAGAAAAQELGGRQHGDALRRRDEAVPQRRDDERDARLVGAAPARGGHVRRDPAEGHVRAPRLAEVGEADEHPVAGPNQRAQLVLGLGDPGRRERGPLRLELERLAERHLLERRHRLDEVGDRVELHVAASAGRGVAQQLGRLGVRALDLRHEVGGVPGEHGRAGDELGAEGHEPGRDERPIAVLLPPARVLGVGPVLRRRVDQDVVAVAQRPLGEGGEGGKPFDLVAEELDPDGLAARGREDVDEAAPDRELTALVDGVGALVAGLRERRDQVVERELLAQPQLHRGRAAVGRVDPLDQGVGRDGDEAATGERVQRAVALADEVRRGVEAAPPPDAAGWQERGRVRRQECRRRLGQRAGVVVVRADDRERPRLGAVARVPERGDERRQDRFGHARPRDPGRGAAGVGGK